MLLKLIFTWWNKQTIGTFLKTLFFGEFVGTDEFETDIIKIKRTKDGLFTQEMLRQQKLHQIGICGCTTLLTKFQYRMRKNITGRKNILKIKLGHMKAINQPRLKKTN